MIDLRDLESRPARRDYQLRCPDCGDWVRALVILDSGKLSCRRCVDKSSQHEEAGAHEPGAPVRGREITRGGTLSQAGLRPLSAIAKSVSCVDRVRPVGGVRARGRRPKG